MKITRRNYHILAIPIVLAALLVTAVAVARDGSTDPAITPPELRDHVRYLASPELGGRGSGTEGTRLAAEYIESAFRAAGLRGRGDRGFRQAFTFNAGVSLGKPNSVSLHVGKEERRLKLRADFLPVAFSANSRATGEVLFVGYGISAPQMQYDDYAGVDAKGKIVVILRQTPDGNDPTSRFAPFGPLRYKAMTAREKGAAGILFVTGPLTEQQEDLGGFRFDTSFADSGVPAAVVKRAFVEEMLRPTGKNLEAIQTDLAHGTTRSMPLPGVTATVVTNIVRERRKTDNVLGLLEGSDPKLRDELVVIGAHYDHLGQGGEGSRSPEKGPVTHPGADDNASGTAGLLELAEYFGAGGGPGGAPAHSAQRPRPKRSLLFAAFSGEELGLLGSAHYVKSPPIPLDRTVAMVNMDMIGRAKGKALTVIGTGTSPAWKEILDAANAEPQLDLKTNASGFGASDQSSFYGKDIPVLFFFTGVHPDYHMPSDTWEKINTVGQARILRLVANVVARIAGLPERPKFVRADGDTPQMASAGFGVYLGTIPDYSEQGEGVTLSGVREQSPAEKAGLKAGDVIVQFGTKAIKNVYDYTYALRDARAGEPIAITVLRRNERVTVNVTPERRRG